MKKTATTNYPGHEDLYVRRRERGASGWDTDAVTHENIEAIKHLLSKCDPQPAGAMLELGCGAGNLTSYFAQTGWKAHGLDISGTAITWARERAAALGLAMDFRIGNVLNLDIWPEDTFDLVLDGHCLHCIIGQDRVRFFQEARRVLRPAGKMLILTMAGDASRVPMGGCYDPETRCQLVDGISTRYFGEAGAISHEVENAGFVVDYQELVARRHETETDHLLIVASPQTG